MVTDGPYYSSVWIYVYNSRPWLPSAVLGSTVHSLCWCPHYSVYFVAIIFLASGIVEGPFFSLNIDIVRTSVIRGLSGWCR